MPTSKTTIKETPRTDALVYELQSTPIPFEVAFWQLLELTRTLERENRGLKRKRQEDKAKAPLGTAGKR